MLSQKGETTPMRSDVTIPNPSFAAAVKVLGNKWKLLIVGNLLERPWRFNELRKSLFGISQKVLTTCLRALEEDGILTRTVFPEIPPRVEYALTEAGKELKPVIDAMRSFGEKFGDMLSSMEPEAEEEEA